MDDAMYAKFVEWYVIPLPERSKQNLPMSYEDFAKSNGTDMETLYTALDKPSFQQDIYNAALQWAKMQTPAMFHVLADQALRARDAKAITRFIKTITDADKAQQDQGTNISFNIQVNDEQYQQILARESVRVLGSGS